MKRRNFLKISGLAGFHTAFAHNVPLKAALGINAPGSLFENFISPHESFRASCYWWWFNGLVDKEGIRRDLQEFRNKGIGGVLLVNSAGGLGGVTIPQGAKLFSEEWKELFRFAMKEARRLGIEVGVNMSSGWCMGGPWIKPENAGRWYLQSTLEVEGPVRFSGTLPLPGNRTGYDRVFNPPGYKDYLGLPLEQLDYRDTAVVAIPVKSYGNFRMTGMRLGLLDAKANRRDASNVAKSFEITDPVNTTLINDNNDHPVPISKIIDLTHQINKEGVLEWDVPEGNWIIVRTGHRMTGSRLMIAQPEADGLSVGWFNREGVETQFREFGKVIIDEAAKAGTKPAYFCDDSFEDGFPNWTEKILERFQQYRGYDATPYLPVLTGFIIESADVSDRFLNDYRKTIADCMADEHYKRFADLCHEQGMLVQNESAGPSRSGTICLDGLKNLGRSDMPCGEFWLGPDHENQSTLTDDKPYTVSRLDFGQNKVTKMAASAAHIYGRKTVSAESFTTYRHWMDAPGTLKQALDRAFCEGVNRIVLHTSTATRPKDGLPGYEYGAGTHFNPNVTWWPFSTGILSYITRCQYLLRTGLFVADVLFYNGDTAPNLVAQKHVDPRLGKGYDYDVCNEEVLLTRVSVNNGSIVLPDGMKYRLLVLPVSKRMPVSVLKKIIELVNAGATVIGAPPQTDSGLYNYPHCDTEIKRLANELWAGPDQQKRKGRILNVPSIREILLQDSVLPDFEYLDPEAWIDFIHRSTAEAEIYFITNRQDKPVTTTCVFRCTGRAPELWDAVAAKAFVPEFEVKAGRTAIKLNFDAFQSVFVVFPKTASRKTAAKTGLWQISRPLTTIQQISGSWQVSFDTKWGGPGLVKFEALTDWSVHADERIKYYSGKAVYTKVFDLKEQVKQGEALYLDLGVVKNICRVELNGKDMGIVWTTPWMVDISDVVKERNNHLRIEVINLWPNRLIGDAALPAEKRMTNTNIVFKADAPLLPSGLLGPVLVKK